MKFEAPNHVVWRDLVNEIVILDLSTGTYFGLEGVDNDIWRLIVTKGSRAAVIDALSRCHRIDVERLTTDVDALIKELLDKGLLCVREDDGLANPES